MRWCDALGWVNVLIIVGLTIWVAYYLFRDARPSEVGGHGAGSVAVAGGRVRALRGSDDAEVFSDGLLFVHADWCPHCAAMKPAFREAADMSAVPYAAVNARDARAYLENHGIRNLPHVVRVYPDGRRRVYDGDRSAHSLHRFAIGQRS